MTAIKTLLAVVPFLVCSILAAAPNPTKPRPVITLANVDRVEPAGELEKDVYRIYAGPGRDEMAFIYWERPIEVVNSSTLAPLRTIENGKRIIHFAASKDAKRIAWCENNSRVFLREVGNDKSIDFDVKNAQPEMTFSPDGKLLATGGYGTKAKLWDMTGKLVRELDCGGEGGLWPVFSPDGKTLAIGNRNHETHLYDVATGKLLHQLPHRMTQEIAFSPDGKTLAAAYVDGKVALWDVAKGELLHEAVSGGQEVFTLDWSPKGDLLVTAGLCWQDRPLGYSQVDESKRTRRTRLGDPRALLA